MCQSVCSCRRQLLKAETVQAASLPWGSLSWSFQVEQPFLAKPEALSLLLRHASAHLSACSSTMELHSSASKSGPHAP